MGTSVTDENLSHRTKIEPHSLLHRPCVKCGKEKWAEILWHRTIPCCSLYDTDLSYGYPISWVHEEAAEELGDSPVWESKIYEKIMNEAAERLKRSGCYEIGEHLDVHCACGYRWRSETADA